MKLTFFRDIELQTKNVMHLASEIDFDLTAFNNYIKSLLMTCEPDKLSKARAILDDVIRTIKDISYENTED